ncbi:hypothetical protein [Cytophaga hutchinsonii]|uniref:Uncharacterized protein n=2 Tax=Cytophaga hutchinsonii TaxID=985 RepID=A0A6N4STU6_CYTH3|nr:hypothetical protein [Cytophaga hutchinsonii]ABG59734.1 hypothetical protein CHU_2480 [Cytophaga hutchinsonii ATCC 33406]SFX65165.1 hypothetical protein SAMN04487930_10752 [Cytophaga hutchinsonii ATCC 33406]
MMKHFLFIILIICTLSCENRIEKNHSSICKSDSTNENWLNFKYDSVITFATIDPFYRILNKGNLIDLSEINDTISVSLSERQIETLDSIINGLKNKPGKKIFPADCFNPRHNIIFLNRDTLVNYISVCYECGYYRSSKPNIKGDLNAFKTLFDNLGLKVFDRPDYHSKYYDSIIQKRKYIR